MVKLVALYPRQQDAEAFSAVYVGDHVPLVERIPGVRAVTVSAVIPTDTTMPAYQLVCEVYFDDIEAVKKGLASDERSAAVRHMSSIFSGSAVVVVCQELHGPCRGGDAGA